MDKQIKILIIEDSSILRYMLIKMIREAGYNDTLGVGSSEEALPLLVKEKIDLVFLDWNLPKMSGLDLLKHIRSRPETMSLNVIMITTIHEKKKILQALKIGLQGYLLKPINKELLLNKIREIESGMAEQPPEDD